MVEFAIVAPVFFFSLVATIDGGLLMFVIGSGNHAAGIGEITLADEGNLATADCDAITNIAAAGLGTTGLDKITEVDIYQLDQDAQGNLSPDGTNYNAYPPADIRSNSQCSTDTTAGKFPWPPSSRFVSASNLTNIGLSIKYTYSYLALNHPALAVVETRYFRLEPQNNA